MTSEGVTVYVKIKLADERYCDGCLLFRVRPTIVIDADEDDVGQCAAFPKDDGIERARRDVSQWPQEEPKWLRPQECIKASMSIGDDVRSALYARTEDRAESTK